MLDHWEENGPPVYISVAAYLNWGGTKGKNKGSEAPDKANGPEPEYGNLNDLVSMFGGSGGTIGA